MLRLSRYTRVILLLLLVIFGPLTVRAAVDWEISGGVQLDETPIAVARAQGAELMYVLTDRSKVLIYSDAGKLVGTILVDSSVTDMAISAKGDQLYLIDGERKTLKAIDVRFIVDFNTDGSPFLGPADAGVVVAVFSDFQ